MEQEADIESLHKQKIAELLSRAEEVPSKELQSLQQHVFQMLNYAVERLNYYEEYRRRYLQIGLAAIGLAVAILAIGGASYVSLIVENPEGLRWYTWLPYAAIVVTVITVAWVGMRQLRLYIAHTSREYAFREIADTDWFYRYILSDIEEEKLLKTMTPEMLQRELQKIFLEDYSRYGQRLLARSPKDRLVNDIEQLTSLHRVVQHKRAQTVRMRKVLWRDIRAVFVAGGTAIVLLIVAALAGVN